MEKIDNIAQRCFYIGVLTMTLDFKIQKFEKKDTSELTKLFSNVNTHINLLKEISIVGYFDFTLIKSALDFSGDKLGINDVKALLAAYKYFKTYKRITRG